MPPSEPSAPSRGQPARRGNADNADPVTVAREICLHQLAARPRSRAELAAVMRRRGVEEDVAERVLDRLVEVGLVDDAAFAAAFVASARAGRGLARPALAAELRRRGVDVEISSGALAVVDAEDEEATARSLVARRLRTMEGLPDVVRVRRLVAQLTRKGYPLDLAMRVVTEAVPGGDGDPDGLD